jgi:periplasmic divalent cation tolerance protein
MTTAALLVLTTCDSSESAAALAEALVAGGLAACVNAVDGVTSTYRWQGRIERAAETLLLIKTTQARYGEVEATIRSLARYELPEVIAVPVTAGLPAYLAWIGESTGRE